MGTACQGRVHMVNLATDVGPAMCFCHRPFMAPLINQWMTETLAPVVRWLGRRWRVVLGVGWALVVGVLTLQPGGMSLKEAGGMPSLCLICGSRGSADAVLNLLMFVPLGLCLGGTGRSIGKLLLFGLGASFFIEFTQLWLPGRHPALGDLIWNSGGAVVGAGLFSLMVGRLAGGQRNSALAAGVGAAFAFLFAGFLLVPSPTDADYWGQWTADLGSMPRYDGQVVEATLNSVALPSYKMQSPTPHRTEFTADWVLDGTVVAGSAPRAVSPILSIYDGHQREIVLLGAHGRDLVFRERMRAADLRFDVPDLRLLDAFETVRRSDTIRVAVARVGADTCLEVSRVRRCGLGVTPGRIWGLLLYLEGPPEEARQVLDLLWLAALFGTIGLLSSSWARAALGAAVASAGMVSAIALTPLIPGGWPEVAACFAGLVAGRWIFLIWVSWLPLFQSDKPDIA